MLMLTYVAARQCSVGLLCLVRSWLEEERRGGSEGRKGGRGKKGKEERGDTEKGTDWTKKFTGLSASIYLSIDPQERTGQG